MNAYIPHIAIMVVCLILSAYFSATETAFSTMSKTRLKTLAEKGNKRAELVYEILSYQIKKYIGSYAVAMGGVDAIVFTGGVGENDAVLRERCLQDLKFMGIELDTNKNLNIPRGTVEELQSTTSKVKIFRIPTDEELVIARDAKNLIQK